MWRQFVCINTHTHARMQARAHALYSLREAPLLTAGMSQRNSVTRTFLFPRPMDSWDDLPSGSSATHSSRFCWLNAKRKGSFVAQHGLLKCHRDLKAVQKSIRQQRGADSRVPGSHTRASRLPCGTWGPQSGSGPSWHMDASPAVSAPILFLSGS